MIGNRRLVVPLASGALLISLAIGIFLYVQTRAATAALDPDPVAQVPVATEAADAEEEVARPDGWEDASHSDQAAPTYEVIFPQDEVKQLTITIAPAEWEAMQANMTELFGERAPD